MKGQPLPETRSRRRPQGAELLVRVARRPQPPGRSELARLEAVVDQIPRRSALLARRRARLAAGAATLVLIGTLGTGVWAWRGRRGPARAEASTLAAAEMVRPLPLVVPARAPVATLAPREETAAPDVARPKKVIRRRSFATNAAGPSAPPRERPAQPEIEAPAADGLTREIALVDAARSDVKIAPSRALAALDTHRREFPRGQLAAEREFLAVEALRRMNRTDEARRRAAALQTSYPSSSYAARANRLLQPAP